MESRSGVAHENEEYDIPAEGWKIVVLIEHPCDVMAQR
jgi:hypothetical protein